MPPSTAKPWEYVKPGEGGGGGSAGDPLAARFVESLSIDTRLYDADIRGSLAHARMLAKIGLISPTDLAEIERGLAEIRREIESAPAGPTAVAIPGAWPGWQIELEDVHMCIESALIAKTGDAGRRLHTGRSRNDQVALDLRLWLREACCTVSGLLNDLLAAFKKLAREQGDAVMPSYTHLQRAQPIVLGAELMAWHAMFSRDQRSFDALPAGEDALSASPLGSGAVAGSSLPIDRELTARDLGFSSPSLSSIDATASRDEALDFLFALTRTALHLSRLAEQWTLYCSAEFGFLTLADAFTTGSSMMPQKRNPDMLELIRGRSGTVIGHAFALATILKGLPLAYNRDLQEDKRHVFAAYDVLTDCLRIAARIVASAGFNRERAAAALDRGHPDATLFAERLVGLGIPFRTAHQIVGSLVRLCESSGRHALSQLSPEEIAAAVQQHTPGTPPTRPTKDLFQHLGAPGAVNLYRTLGHAGTGPGGYRDWAFADEPARAPAVGASSLFAGNPDTSPPRDLKGPDPLIDLYRAAGRTLDDLPYTPEFERIYESAALSQPPGGEGGAAKRDVFRRLHNLRKAGKLPQLGKAASSPVRLEPAEELWLRDRVEQVAGTLGQRDQLPYDPKFDMIVEAFNARTSRDLSPHDVWRLVAKLAK